MARGWSEGASSVTVVGSTASSSSGASNPSERHEVDEIYKLLKKEPHDALKTVIAVVRPSNFTSLDQKLQNPWWKFWKPKPGVFVTTPRGLQRTINQVEDEGICQHLTLFLSKRVQDVRFHVSSGIHTLSIFRCSHRSHTSSHHTQRRRPVVVEGSSTFGSVRLDEWQDMRHRHALFIGDGVAIGVQMEGASGTPWARPVANLSNKQKEQVYGHFICMKQEERANEPSWSRWRKHLAIVVGLLSGVGEIAPGFEVLPTGCLVEYRFGATVSHSAKTRTAVSAAGQAGLLAPRVAAPVYFIPWRGLLKWIHDALATLCEKYWTVLERLWQFVAGTLLKGSDVQHHHVRPGLSRSKSSRDGKHISWKGRGVSVSHAYVGES